MPSSRAFTIPRCPYRPLRLGGRASTPAMAARNFSRAGSLWGFRAMPISVRTDVDHCSEVMPIGIPN